MAAPYDRWAGQVFAGSQERHATTAHKLALMVYFMLTRAEAFVDQGQQRYAEQQRECSIAALKRRTAKADLL